MNELKERYSKKNSIIEDYCIGKLVNKGNLPKNKAVKEKQKRRRKYLKVSVLQWRKRNAKRKKEILEGECVAMEKEKVKEIVEIKQRSLAEENQKTMEVLKD